MIPINNAAEQNSHAAGRPARQSSSIGDPGTIFFVQTSGFLEIKKMNPKERNLRKGRLVETAAGMEIDLRSPSATFS
jgi:hypothetical protein